jgi:hypothetical protein
MKIKVFLAALAALSMAAVSHGGDSADDCGTNEMLRCYDGSTNPFCEYNTCVDDGDCSDYVCDSFGDTSHYTCEAGYAGTSGSICVNTYCSVDSDCAEDYSCDTSSTPSSCTYQACTYDSDCDSGESCDGTSQDGYAMCIETTCSSDADCALGTACDTGTATCTLMTCITDSDCSNGQVCDSYSDGGALICIDDTTTSAKDTGFNSKKVTKNKPKKQRPRNKKK